MDDQSEMMFCPDCGERIRRSVRFCRFCGAANRKRTQQDWGPDRDEPRGGDTGAGSDSAHPSRNDERQTQRSSRQPSRTEQRASGLQSAESGLQSADGPSQRRTDTGTQNTADDSPVTANSIGNWRDTVPGSIRDPEESGLRVLGVAIGLGMLAMVLLVVFTVVGSVPVSALGVPTAAALLFGTVIGQYVGFMGLSLWYLRYRGLDWRDIKSYLGIRKPTVTHIAMIFGAWLVILAGAVVIGLLAQFAADLVGAGEPGQAEQDITQILVENPELVPLAILMMFLVVGPCEEILFRGVIQGRLRERFSAFVAIGVTSVFFGALHVGGIGGSLEGIIIALSVLTLAGAVLGSLYEYTQNLVAVALLHGFHNSMVVLFIYASAVYDLESALLGPVLQAIPI